MNDVTKYYEILGLKPGASIEEVKEAYKDLLKVWHPDRFAHDPKLQAYAQKKLKEINEAYEKLKSHYTEYSNHPPPEEEYQSDSSYQENDSDQEARGNKEHESSSQPPPKPPKEPPSRSGDFTGQAPRIYPQPIWHFVLLCIVTFGIYEIYWFYLNWKFIKEHYKLNIYPVWRAIFAPLFAYSLFKKIFNLAEVKGYKEKHSPGLLTFGYIALLILVKLPDPYWLISIFSFVPLIIVVRVFNYYLEQEQPNLKVRTKFIGREIALLIIGGIVLILVLIGIFIPTTPKNYDECITKYTKNTPSKLATRALIVACKRFASGDSSKVEFDKCILENMPGVMNDISARAVYQVCRDKTAKVEVPVPPPPKTTGRFIFEDEDKTAKVEVPVPPPAPAPVPAPMVRQQTFKSALDYVVEGEQAYYNGRYEDARIAFISATVLDPRYHIAFHDLGMTLIEFRNYQGAVDNFSVAINLEPDFDQAYIGRAIAYDQMRQFSKALNDYKTAASLGNQYAQQVLSQLRKKENDDKSQAPSATSNALQETPESRYRPSESEFLYNQGVASYKEGKYDAAIEYFNKSIALRDSAETYKIRGIAYYKTGQYDKAIKDFTKVIEIEPTNRLAYFNRGSTYYKKGQYNIAVVDLQKACNLGDEDGCKKLKIILEKK